MKESGIRQSFLVSNTQRSTIAILLLFFFFYLPFIDKAFHIDAPAFINLAKMFDWNPLVAFPLDYDYMGMVLPDLLPYEATHPLLIPYVIKIVTAVFGQSEVALHLVFALFPLIAIWSLIKLNAGFFPDSRSSTAVLAIFFFTMPAFMVNSQNVMTDVPSLAFVLLALAGFVCGMGQGSRRMMWVGSFALLLAVFTSYQNLVFPPLIFLYAVLKRKLDAHCSLALAMPVLVLFSWLIAVYVTYDIFPLLKSGATGGSVSIADEIKRGLVGETLSGKIVFVVGFIGSAMVWILPVHCVLQKTSTRIFISLVCIAAGSYLAATTLSEYPISAKLIQSAFIAVGVQTIAVVVFLVRNRIREGRNVVEALFLLIWFLCVVGYNVVALPFGAARYLLPAFPPLLLVILNDQAWTCLDRSNRRLVLGALFGTALFSLGAAYSDYRYAETYREFAGEVSTVRANVGGNSTFWYIGEWGMRHYMDQIGARVLPAASNDPKAGDFVVIPDMPRFWEPSQLVQQRLVVYARREYTSPLPIRLFNKRSHAGFYSHLWGMLPLTFSTQPDEAFVIYRVEK